MLGLFSRRHTRENKSPYTYALRTYTYGPLPHMGAIMALTSDSTRTRYPLWIRVVAVMLVKTSGRRWWWCWMRCCGK